MKIYLDLSPAYIPFVIQCTKSAGDKIDPTVDNLIIYEEGGADAVFDSTQITGSPFNPDKVNAKTGLWGVLVAKSAFTAGKWYIALWEMTVDSITTAKVERYFACNASQFKADVSNLDVAVSSRLATAGYTAPDNASITTIKVKTDQLTFTTPNKVDATTVVSSGTNAVTITVYEHGTTTPIPGYNIDLYNAAESVFFGTLVTDINGQAQTNLNDGTYHLRGNKMQFIPDNPVETFVVDATHLTKTIYATAFVTNDPPASDACQVYEYCFMPNGATPMSSVMAKAKIINLPYDAQGKYHSGQEIDGTYNATTGYLYWNIAWGAMVEFYIKDIHKTPVQKTVPSLTSKRLKEIA